IMTDQNMVARTGANVWNKAEVAHISSNLVTINNDLRLLNVRPTVTMRDLHTYVHEAPASTTTSGSSRRPSSIPYSKSGYSGTLTRFREDNIGYRVSGTRRERRTGTRTVSRTFSATHSNNVWGSKRVFDDGGTRHTGSGQSSPAPSSKFINSGGFSGSIPRGPTTGSSGSWRSVGSGSEGSRGYTDYYRSGTWTAHYRGSLSKQERYTYTVNVPYSYWVSRWRGHYSGTLYKSVKQSFTTVFTNEKASRYTIYVSKNTINNMAYVNQLLATADTNFILIGSPAIRSQLSHIKFFDIDSKPFEELLQDALNFISENNPYISQHTALAHIPTHREEMVAFTQDGTNFNVSHNDFEDEGDPIIEEQWKITQDQNHFATPLGFETALVLDTWFAGVAPTRFNTTGKFSIQRRVLDNPSLDSNFTEFNYLSNEPALEIFAHRRPVAMATLDAVHTGGGNYNITWADQSFDFDHVGRRTDRGIIEHVVRYSKNSGPWFYGIPASLLAGSYDLEYTVRDVENTWSDVFRVDFVLHSPPNPHTDPPPPVFTPESVEFETSLKTQNPTFGLNSIPASETLVIHDTWTRYADTVKIDVELLATAAPAVTFHHNASDTTDPNFPKDIWWRDLVYNIPATVPNGTYTLRVTAVDHLDRRTNRDFSVVVDTPINISINLPEVVIGGEDLIITATTSKYVNEGDFHAKLFEGMLEGTILPDGTILKTKLETEELEFLLLKEEDNKRHWEITYFVATDIPEKTYPDAYIANFRAYAINHTSAVSNFETQNVAFELQQLRLEDLRITSIYDAHWRDNFLERNNQPTNLKTEGIQIKDMPVYINDKHKWVRLGNIVELKIDSMGLNGEHDEIEINVRYHALDRMNKLHNVDVYVYDDEEEFVKIQNSQYNQIVYNLTLNAQNHRKPYETDPGDNNRNTWEFILYLPPETRVVKRGRELDLVNRNHFDHLLLVVIEITAKKANRLQYSYSINAEGWGEDTGSIYGKNKPTKLNLLGHGINRGEVFWFNLGQNILQDIEIERGW
ncbi:hypothetical protein JYU11_02975, partial [bacterium AH-315-G05]|nr:hypothetical protein [bacterium AH-315-G05]